jgi:hypothetical protein
MREMDLTMSERSASAAAAMDVRCHCGKLIARWEGSSLVIKCTRCGRFVAIHHSAILGTPPDPKQHR